MGKLNFHHNTIRTLNLGDGTSCFEYAEATDWWCDPDGNDDACHCSGNETYAYTTYSYVTVCIGGGGYGGVTLGWIGGSSTGGSGTSEIFPDLTTLGSYTDDDANYTTGDYDNTVIPDFDIQTQPWPIINSVIPTFKFVEYNKTNCLDLVKAQIAKLGYKISGYGDAGQTFVTYTSLPVLI